MAQEYHCFLKFGGPLYQRLAVIRDTMSIRTWDWVSAEVNFRPKGAIHSGRDSGVTLLDFYRTSFPVEIEEVAARFPAVTFECTCMDLTAEVIHKFHLRDGVEWEATDSPIVWEGDRPGTDPGQPAAEGPPAG